MKTHTATWKKKQLEDLKVLIKSHSVIGIASLERFPASLFQVLRKKLAGKAIVKVTKTRVLKKALIEAGLKNDELDKLIEKSVAVIFTELNPFELCGFLKKNKGRVSAKPGMEAPADIIVPKGDTGLPPGPALSDLKAAGLNPRMQGATIIVPEDVVVVKKGQIVSKVVSSTLSKLNIKPISVGLSLIAAYEKGQVYKAEVLDIDAEMVFNQFVLARKQAFNLAINAGYFTAETIEVLLGKAFREAKAVAIEAKILEETASELSETEGETAKEESAETPTK